LRDAPTEVSSVACPPLLTTSSSRGLPEESTSSGHQGGAGMYSAWMRAQITSTATSNHVPRQLPTSSVATRNHRRRHQSIIDRSRARDITEPSPTPKSWKNPAEQRSKRLRAK
uniref:Uncharacterized protein n=1 Tax=Heligmosomoides polygyrus TaxID=6339 RepID=A0A183GJ25_HELPZ